MKRIFILGFLMFFGFYTLFSQATDEQIRQAANTLGVPYADLKQFIQSYQNTTSTDVITVNATNFVQEYRENQVRADNTYKGKTLRITGVVDEIKTNYIDLKGPRGTIICARIYFRSIELPKIANLEVGQTVTFIGIGDGILGGFPRVNDAVLVVN
jgi:hypothetical protein